MSADCASFPDEPLFGPLRFARVFLEQCALGGGSRDREMLSMTDPPLPRVAPECVENLRVLGNFDEERDAAKRAAAAAARDADLARASSHVASAASGSGSRTHDLAASAKGWACPACTLVNPATDVTWCGVCVFCGWLLLYRCAHLYVVLRCRSNVCDAPRPVGAALVSGDAPVLTFSGARPGLVPGKAATAAVEWPCKVGGSMEPLCSGGGGTWTTPSLLQRCTTRNAPTAAKCSACDAKREGGPAAAAQPSSARHYDSDV